MKNNIVIISIILLLPIIPTNCQPQTILPRRDKLYIVIGGESLLYTGTMVGLYGLWYKDYPLTSFHFFNDNDEWLYMDKMGHVATGYYVSRLSAKSYEWAGIQYKKSAIYGGLTSLFFLTSIECFDGFSENWGFSYGDFIANIAGISMFVSQNFLWQEQRILIKFSYHDTPFAKYRPQILGEKFQERLLKDYNGHTAWLSFNILRLCPNLSQHEESKFPLWLNIAIGYGADGMLGGTSNPPSNENGTTLPSFERYSQYFLSPDIDLTKIKTKSKFINTVFQIIGFIKFPLPALEYNKKQGLKGHWLYF